MATELEARPVSVGDIVRRRIPPIGSMLDVAGRSVHVWTCGDGGPAVVLVNGGGAMAMDWHSVQPELSATALVCSFDRPGAGWSRGRPRRPGLVGYADEMLSVLDAANIDEPVILVGASLGGPIALAFAARNPERTAGVVLVDSTYEDVNLSASATTDWGDETPSAAARAQAWLIRSAINVALGPAIRYGGTLARFVAGCSALITTSIGWRPWPRLFERIPAQYRALTIAMSVAFPSVKALRADFVTAETCISELRDELQSRSLPDVPAVSLTAASLQEQFDREGVVDNPQANLLAGLTDVVSLVVDRSGHLMQLDRPDAIVTATTAVIRAVRQRCQVHNLLGGSRI